MSKYAGKIVTNQAPAGYSVFFDGSGDYLSVASNAAFAFGTGDFTLEFWLYPTSTTQRNITFPTVGAPIIYMNTSRQLVFENYGAPPTITSTGTLTLNTWSHCAVSRASGTTRLFLNGVLEVSSSSFSATSFVQSSVNIGTDAGTTFCNGYMANVRVVKGTALYTAAFTPPTQLLNVTNTSLLTCNSPAIVDQSSNAFAITVNGNSAVSTFTPFTAYVPYNPSLGASTPGVWTLDEAMQAAATRQWNMYDPSFQNTTLLLHGNGTNGAQNNTFLDSSSNNFTITRNGNTTQGSFSPFSQTGWSNYFDGTSGQFINGPANTAFNFGTGDFTVEAWVYPTSTSGTRPIIEIRTSNLSANGFALLSQSGALTLNVYTNNVFVGASSNSMTLNAWNHVALTRSGNTWTYWINGVSGGSFTNSSTQSDGGTTGPKIGGSTTAGEIWIGYISNARITKGGALYSSTFTPSTTPLTTTVSAGTVSLLTCQSNRFIDNSSNSFSITVNGTTSVQAFSPFYPTAAYTPATIGGSGYFDGTGDYLTSATNTALQLGSSDFSIEWWEYRTALNNVDTAIVCGDGTFNALLGYYNSGFPRFYLSTTGSSWNVFSDAATGAIAANSWNHFVLTRSGTAFRVFLNGVLSIYATGSGSVTQTTNQIFISGGINGSSVPIEGYMAGVRFVKGSIPTSYQTSSTTTNTSIFTPPTTPVTTTSQGATSGDVKYLVNFTNAGIVDSTAKNVLETVGNAQISTTQSKFGGSSMFFNGSTGQLVLPNSENFNVVRGNFTVECWVYLTGSAGSIINYTNGQSSNSNFAFELYQLNSSTIYWSIFETTTQYLASSTAFALNTWVHIAGVRNGNTLTVYLNGVAGSTTANVTNVGGNIPAGATLKVSGYNNGTNMITGYVDDLRITKGVARYTANFTPQTSQWQDQ